MRFVGRFQVLAHSMGLLLLTACAGNPDTLPAGASRELVLATYGAPTAVWILPPQDGGGERLQYSRQPFGQQVYNIDLDRSGRVVAARQAMSEAAFAQVQPDVWRASDVERAFGKPATIGAVHAFKGIIWTYRFAQPFGLNKQFHVFIDASGLVKRTQVTDEPELIEDRVSGKR